MSRTSRISPDEALSVFIDREDTHAPLTATEVAEELDCARRTAYNKLEVLHDRGELSTKKVGSRGRVWWRSATNRRSTEHEQRGTPEDAPQNQRRFEAVFNDPDSYIGLLAPDGTVLRANETIRSFIDTDPADIEGEAFSETPWWTHSTEGQHRLRERIERAARGEFVRFEADHYDSDGTVTTIDWIVRPVTGDDGEIVSLIAEGRDITERKHHEQAIEALHDASRRLIHADTQEAVSEIAVEATERILGLPLNGLWLYEEADQVLRPIAWTEEGATRFGEPPAFPLHGSLVGQVFKEGTHRVYDDVTAKEDRYAPDTDVRSELIVPLGDYGVLNITSLDVAAFDDVDISLARILASNVEAALERAERVAERKAYQRELERQRDELAMLNQINTLIEEIIRALVTASTRDEIEQIVCDRLAGSDFYANAWIGEHRVDGSGIGVRTGAGVADESVRSITDLSARQMANTDIDQCLSSGTVTVTRRPADTAEGPDSIQEIALDREFQSTITVPLSFGDTVYAGLVVNGNREETFGQHEQHAFEVLGDVVGFAINAVNNRKLLLADTAVELELTITDPNSFFVVASDRLSCSFTVEGMVPAEGGALLCYVTVEGTDPDALLDAIDDEPGVTEPRIISHDADRCVLECVVRGASGVQKLVEYGATVRKARFEAGTGRIVVRLASGADAQDAVAEFRERFPKFEMVAKRTIDLSERSIATTTQQMSDHLTERQQEVLRAAFFAGYYDDPRGTTAQELADSLGIASSTLYQHQQAAHRKLLAILFEPSVI